MKSIEFPFCIFSTAFAGTGGKADDKINGGGFACGGVGSGGAGCSGTSQAAVGSNARTRPGAVIAGVGNPTAGIEAALSGLGTDSFQRNGRC